MRQGKARARRWLMCWRSLEGKGGKEGNDKDEDVMQIWDVDAPDV